VFVVGEFTVVMLSPFGNNHTQLSAEGIDGTENCTFVDPMQIFTGFDPGNIEQEGVAGVSGKCLVTIVNE
jgi:hypothetical protein